MTCPRRDRLERYFEDALNSGEAAEVRTHVPSCKPCSEYLRRLAEEAEGLRRHLPSINAPSRAEFPPSLPPARDPWKKAFLLASAAAVLLGLALIHTAVREDTESARLLRNLQKQVQTCLAERRPDLAANALSAFPSDATGREAADLARLDIAAASPSAEAAALLDEIQLAGKDRAVAERASRARVDAYVALFHEQVLRDGAVPTPFEIDTLRLEPRDLRAREEMSRLTNRLVSSVAEHFETTARFGGRADPALACEDSLASIAQYALGEQGFSAVRLFDDETRVQFGDVLFRERQFDRALDVWQPVLGDPRVIRRVAELAALRRFAPQELQVWDYDVEKLLGRDVQIESEAIGLVARLFQSAKSGSVEAVSRLVEQRKGIPRDEVDAAPSQEPAIFFPDGDEDVWSAYESRNHSIAPDPEELYLLLEHRQFQLSAPPDRPFTTRSGATLELTSAYRGPIRGRLFRVRDFQTLTGLNPENLLARRSELEPVDEWETQVAPIWENSTQVATWTVQVPHRGPGLYVLLADARYCPVIAVAKFIITDAALVLQTASDRVLVFAADRSSGAPQAGLPVQGRIDGQYVLRPEDLVPADDSNSEEYQRGFARAWAETSPEPDATASYRRGHASALELRALHPATSVSVRGTTGPDGLVEWPTVWLPGYRYQLVVESADPVVYSRVESTYTPDENARALKALVYADRPVYRPGDTVSFKGILRMCDADGLLPYAGREAFFEFSHAGLILQSYTLPVTEFGTASGALEIPADLREGPCMVRVNHGPAQELFRVEEYRKPEFEIVLEHPSRMRPGEGVGIDIQVRYYTGDPVAHAEVHLRIDAAAVPSVAGEPDPTWAWYYDVASKTPASWQAFEERTLTTDAAGHAFFSVMTDPLAPLRYLVTALAVDGTRRSARRTSGFEATGAADGEATSVQCECDRPTYYPGEAARLHFHADGATALRVEERAKGVERPFLLSIPLVNGDGSCEYPVPEEARDLQVGVRKNDEWVWKPVPIRIVPRPARSGLVSVQVDRSRYRLGEKAMLVVQSNERDQYVLLEFAAGRIHRREVFHLQGKPLEIPVEIREEDVPNVGVVALAVRGDRLGKATAQILVPPVDRFLTVEVATDRPEYRPGDPCRATVRVTDCRGRPVPACELSLAVVDEALFALWEDQTPDLREFFHRYHRPIGVREEFFFRQELQPWIVWKASTFVKGIRNLDDAVGLERDGSGHGRYGGRLGGRESLVARGGGGAGSAWPRSQFETTAFWQAHITTGADGTAAVSFPFPDNLTTFRFTARGITRDHRVGSVRQSALVRKPFFARLAAPRVLQEGNQVAVSGLVHNYSKETQSVRTTLGSPFPILRSTAPELLAVGPGEVAQVEFLLHVDHFIAAARFEFTAQTEHGDADAVSIEVPCRRHGVQHREGRAGAVAQGDPREESFRAPPGAIPGTIALRLDLDAGIHTAISESVEPLIDFPYGCVEQTMSRFMPAVAAARALRGVPNRWSTKLPAVVATGLRRLYDLQNSDGSWGWWHGGGSEAMTAYVLYGLAVCKKAGVGVDRAVAGRAAAYLSARSDPSLVGSRTVMGGRLPISVPVDGRVCNALALAEHESAWGTPGIATRRLIARLSDRASALQSVEEAILALAAARVGMKEESERLAVQAERRPIGDVPTASFLLQLAAIRGGDPSAALRFVLGHRTGNGWCNTMESAFAILGLASVLESAAPSDTMPPGRVTVEVDGALVRDLPLPGRVDPAFDGRILLPEPPGGWGEKVVVRLTLKGNGLAFYTIALEALIGGEDPPPVQHGLTVAREYFEKDGDAWVPVEGWIRAGRPVLVHVSLDSDQPREYLMVTDPRPDGFEPFEWPLKNLKARRRVVESSSDRVDVSDGWQTRLDEFRRTVRGDGARESAWAVALLREIGEQRRFHAMTTREDLELAGGITPAAVEHRDDRSIFFLDSLPAGTTHIYYVVRPEASGRLHALPTQAAPMYEPEVFGSGAEARFDVTDAASFPSGETTRKPSPGIDGLPAVLATLDSVDADELIALLPSGPCIGDLLLRFSDERTIQAWLAADTAISAAGPDLRERIEAARADIATRRLCAAALSSLPAPKALVAIEAALASDRLFRRVFDGASAGDLSAIDTALLWASEDRGLRLDLLAAAQKIRGTALVPDTPLRSATLADILVALGSQAPTGADLVAWKLAQRGAFASDTLAEFAAWSEAALGLPMVITGERDRLYVAPASGRVSEIFDQVLGPLDCFYRIRDGAVRVGSLEQVAR